MRCVGLAPRYLVEAPGQPAGVPDIPLAQLSAHCAANSPAVLRGHLDPTWPPLSKWCAQYVATKCAHRRVRVRRCDDTGFATPPILMGEKYEVETMTASAAMAALSDAVSAGVHAPIYAAQLQLSHALPELAIDALPPPPALAALGSLSKTAPAAYFGVGNRTRIHFDGLENVLCVVSGRKEVGLWHPAHGDMLDGGDATGAAAALALRVVLYPGDALYLPCCWWHEIGSPPGELSISVSYWAAQPAGKGVEYEQCFGGKDGGNGEGEADTAK
jgi:hypothetical protein